MSDTSHITNDTDEEALAHFGVKGMRWGQRKGSSVSSRRSERAQKAIERAGGSRGKAAAIALGKGVAGGIILKAGTDFVNSKIDDPFRQTGVAMAAGLIGVIGSVKVGSDIANIATQKDK